MALSNLSNIKTYLGIDLSNTADDSLLTLLMTRAQATIEQETGLTFDQTQEETKYFTYDDIDGSKLYFGEMLATITSITNGDGTVVASTDYITLPKRMSPYIGVELRWDANVVWDTLTDDIAVKGKWGYSTTPPPNIMQAFDRLVMFLYRTKDNADADRIMFTDQGTIMPGQLPNDVMRMLSYYRPRT